MRHKYKMLKLLSLCFKALLGPWLSTKSDTASDPLPVPSRPTEPDRSLKVKISLDQYLMKRATPEQLSPQQALNSETLLKRIDALFSAYTGPVNLSSGYRPASVNASIGGAAQSWHTQCAAIDLKDSDGKLWDWCLKNLELCADLGLWLEDKRWTPTWVHLQIYPPRSGARIFRPNANPPANPTAFNGVYDKKWDSKSPQSKQ